MVWNTAWVIAPRDADSVTLQFTQLSTENNYDVVTVFACPDIACTQGQQIAVISGTTLPEALSTDTGIFKIAFTSDSSGNFRGFQASFEAFGGRAANCPSASDLEVRTVGTDAEGTINFYSGYLNNAQCQWILQLQGSGVLEVSFPQLQTEQEFDLIRISECADPECRVVDELQGTVVSGSVDPSLNFTTGSSTVRQPHPLLLSRCLSLLIFGHLCSPRPPPQPPPTATRMLSESDMVHPDW